MRAGRLPNLARLQAEGAFLRCRSTTPAATFPAWTTCVTGVNPGRHGIFDFTEMARGTYQLRFVNSTYRKAPALWQVLSEAGRRVAVLGVPATYPPEPVNGVMLSGFDSPVASAVDPSFVQPREYFELVKGWRFADYDESNVGAGWHARTLPRLLRKIEQKEAIAAEILAREPWDFFMAVFSESDTVAHHYWMFHDPDSPRYQPGMSDAIEQVYARLDAAVGRLREAAGGDCLVGVVSDHGFGGASDGVVHLNNWLEERGYLRRRAGGGAMKALALALVPTRLRGVLFRRLQRLATRAESRARFAGIDWQGTKAWSEELNYFPSIRVNLHGREPDGQVAPAEYGDLVRRLCAELESWEPVARAWPRDTLYRGPCTGSAPDIVLELARENGYAHNCLRGREGPAFRRLRPDEYMGAREKGMNGSHRPEGVLFLSRPVAHIDATLEDVAPTMLSALGVPGPPMEGRDLFGARQSGAVETRADHETAPYTPEEEAIIEARLRALGYFE